MRIQRLLPSLLLTIAIASAQEAKLRIVAFGAHPDDADIKSGGVAARFAKLGHLVKFVSVTNGDAGHCEIGGGQLAKRRYAEAQEVARRLGLAEYQILDNHDGELVPSLEVRKQIIRAIRSFNADVVLSPRPNDYHPDHRYTGILVQDAAFMVQIPMVVTDVPPLKKNPVFLYYEDNFQKPQPFAPDIAISIDEVWSQKLDGFEAMPSQFYEAQPKCWGGGVDVPTGAKERRAWLEKRWDRPISAATRKSLEEWYGPEKAKQIRHAEAFEICEYGRRPTKEELKRLFPFF
ncbi:MAG TPA: GlcNAc-PI de-N-acetylase [Solibacterales bacterium]|nr:GlcNAc-PI de-N-acetylase [Bryobacterales bacterium]